MSSFLVKLDAEEMIAAMRTVGLETLRVSTRALNKTLGQVRTATIGALVADTGLNRKDVRPSLVVARATSALPLASLRVTGKRIPLVAFGARQTAAGVSYRLAGGGRGFAPHAFLQTMRSGHRGVFKVRKPARSRKGRPRGSPQLPLVELKGPSLSHVLINKRLDEMIASHAVGWLGVNIRNEITYLVEHGKAMLGDDPSTVPEAA